MVELDESVGGGGFVFAFDAADLTENIEHELAIGGYIGVDPEETIEPIRRLKRLATEKGYQLIPGHDPHVWPELTRHFHERFGVVDLVSPRPNGRSSTASSGPPLWRWPTA